MTLSINLVWARVHQQWLHGDEEVVKGDGDVFRAKTQQTQKHFNAIEKMLD